MKRTRNAEQTTAAFFMTCTSNEKPHGRGKARRVRADRHTARPRSPRRLPLFEGARARRMPESRRVPARRANGRRRCGRPSRAIIGVPAVAVKHACPPRPAGAATIVRRAGVRRSAGASPSPSRQSSSSASPCPACAASSDSARRSNCSSEGPSSVQDALSAARLSSCR